MQKLNRIFLFLVIVIVAFLVVGVLNPPVAEASTSREKALEEIRAAIRALPDYDSLTEADRDAVLRAQRLFEQAVEKYGVTEYDVCTLSGTLAEAVSKVGRMPLATLPPTGGLSMTFPLGLLSLLAGAVILMPRKRKH